MVYVFTSVFVYNTNINRMSNCNLLQMWSFDEFDSNMMKRLLLNFSKLYFHDGTVVTAELSYSLKVKNKKGNIV